MSRAKNLLKNTGILMIAKISTQLINFLLLPLYTSLLTTEQYGEVDIYTSLVMIIVPIFTLQLEMSLFRHFMVEKNEQEKYDIVTTSYCVVAVIVGIVSVLYFLVSLIGHVKYGCLLYLFYFTQVWTAMFLQTCRAKGDNVAYGIGSLLNSSLAVALNVFFVAFIGMRVDGILLSYIIAQTISCFYMIKRTDFLRMTLSGKFRISKCYELLSYSVPLVFNQISSWIINYSDRFIIFIVWGQGTNGIYSLANKFSNITGTFFGVYNVAWTENVIRTIDDNDANDYVCRIFNVSFSLYLIIVTSIINFLPFFFRWMVNKNYFEAYNHIPILLVAMFFSGMSANLGSIYIAHKKTREVSITTMLAGVVNIVCHIFLINTCKLYAASLSTLISFFSLFIYRLFFLNEILNIRLYYKKLLIQLGILVISSIGYYSGATGTELLGTFLNFMFMLWMVGKNKSQLLSVIKR